MADNDSEKSYLEAALKKINTVVARGEKIMKEIPGLVKKAQIDKHDLTWLEESEVDDRVQQRRYGTTQAAHIIYFKAVIAM